jgi:uncharacterized lipoprotein YmbA
MRTHLPRARGAGIALLAALVLTGCFRLSRQSPPIRQYVLGGSAPPAPVAASAAAPARDGRAVGLRRLELASYLAAPAIVVRHGASRIERSEFHRWGERVEEGINRVVAMHLAAAAPVARVDVAPWPARARHDFIVQLRVTRFEGVIDSAATTGQVHVTAGWDIVRPLTGAVLLRGSTEERGASWRAGDYAGLVAGLDAALARVARDVAACLARFPNDSTPPATCQATR